MHYHTVSPSTPACACAEMSCDLLLTTGSGIQLSNHMPFMCADVAVCLEDRGKLSSVLGFFIFTGDDNHLWIAEYLSAALQEQAKPRTCCVRGCNKHDPQITTFPG